MTADYMAVCATCGKRSYYVLDLISDSPVGRLRVRCKNCGETALVVAALDRPAGRVARPPSGEGPAPAIVPGTSGPPAGRT